MQSLIEWPLDKATLRGHIKSMQLAERVEREQPLQLSGPASAPVAACPVPAFMPVRDAAVVLNVSEDYLRDRLVAGEFPGARFGSSWRLLRSFVARLVAEVESGRVISAEEYAASWASQGTGLPPAEAAAPDMGLGEAGVA
jgi:excisionase family DNA binding protein